VERLRKELEVTKIVRGVPMGIKAVVDSPPITFIPPPPEEAKPSSSRWL
jgi:hypothetical protein